MEPTYLSIIPPVLAIFLALYTKNVFLSLFGAILLGVLILHNFAFINSIEAFTDLFMMLLSKGWILKTLAFAILVGSIMEILERSGAIESFVKYMTLKRSIVKSPRSALVITYMIGVLIFIESSITSLIAGAVGKPLCDREGVSRAKLAYVCDSTSAPICSLLLFNGWGALLLGLIITQVESGIIHGNSVEFLIDAVVFNFYSMSALAVTFAVIFFGLYTKGMQNSTVHEYKLKNNDLKNANIWQMLVPILFLVLSIFAFLFITGNGDILKGSGSSSIFYTTLTTMVFMFIFYVLFGRMRAREYMIASVKGANKLFPIAMILLFAFAIGEVTSELKTGLYLASFASENINVSFLAAVIFVLSGIIAFSTGTSWGTFSIMIPIAVPMAVALDANIPLIIGAVISGGVFGDHCSPISDTTIISSLASGCDVVEHVNTQLPYALLSALIAIVFFIIASL